MISRMSSIPVWLAASISITSMCRPSEIALHGSQTLHGVMVGPPCPSGPMQFSALAISRAVEVLPTPRTPVSRKAWAMRPRSMALASVFTIASWPISSAKVCGRYLRARTRYGEALAAGGAWSARSSPRPGDSASSITPDLRAYSYDCEEVEADDPARNRCGCFLPDLTRLATAPSADFRERIWAKACIDASSWQREVLFIGHSRVESDLSSP